jgi:hypothetical protein
MAVWGEAEHDNIVCLDIETAPDRVLIPDWDEGKFPPKPIWHRIVAISFVEARIECDKGLPVKYAVKCCRSGGDADWDDAAPPLEVLAVLRRTRAARHYVEW